MIPLPTLSDNRSALAAGLDATPTDQVVNFLRGLGMGQLKAMWSLAEAARQPLSMSHLVGEEGESHQPQRPPLQLRGGVGQHG